MSRRLPGAGRAPASTFETPVVLTAEQKQRYSRHLLIPEVGVGRPGQAARLEGAAHRRRRPRLAGRALPRRRRRRHDRHRRLRRRRRQQPPAPDHPHDRPGRGAQGRVRAEVDQRPQPRRQGRRPRGDARRRANVERIIAGYDVILDGTDTFETRYILNDAAVAAGIPVVHASVFRFEGQLTTFVPYEGPCYRCLYPTPPPPELAPGLLRGRRARRRARASSACSRPTRRSRSCSGSARRWPAGCSCSMPSRPSSPSSSCGATRTARSAPTRPSQARAAGAR